MDNVKQQVQKFNEYEAAIAIVLPYSELKINGIEDKEGAKIVRSARIECKKLLASIENDRKEIKAPFLEACKTIDANAKVYKEQIEVVKSHLENEEAIVEKELADIEAEKQAVKDRLIQGRINEILTCDVLFTGFSYNLGSVQIMQTEIENLSDEDFQIKFSEMQSLNESLKAEREIKEQAEKAESESLEKVRIEQEKKQAEIDKQMKVIEEANTKMKAEALRLEREKEHAKELQFERDKAEKKRIQDIEDAKKAEALRIEAEAKAKVEAEKKRIQEAERLAAIAPDKEKLVAFRDKLNDVSMPKLSTKEAQELSQKIGDQLDKMNKWLTDVIESL